MNFIVIKSPWPNRIPNGTVIKTCEPRPESEGMWFEVTEGPNPFPEEDGKFRLFDHEYEPQYAPK